MEIDVNPANEALIRIMKILQNLVKHVERVTLVSAEAFVTY